MGTDDDGVATDDAGKRHDQAGLSPGGVADVADGGQGVAALLDGLADLSVQPVDGVDTVLRVEVAVVEVGEGGELLLDLLEVDLGLELLDGALVVDLGGEGVGGSEAGVDGGEVLKLGLARA